MRGARKTALVTIIFVSLGGLLFAYGQGPKQVAGADTSLAKEERERLLAIGKKLFVERCAKCHDERGDKPLGSGPPLSERKLSDGEIARSVSGRFKDAPDEQKRAVALYVRSLMKGK